MKTITNTLDCLVLSAVALIAMQVFRLDMLTALGITSTMLLTKEMAVKGFCALNAAHKSLVAARQLTTQRLH